MSESKTYPTPANDEGLFIESGEDDLLGIFTKKYDNGHIVKQAILPSSGLTAVVRQLYATDTKEIRRFTGEDMEKYQIACITVATTVDGSKQPYEYYEHLLLKDFSRLASMYQALNF